MRWLANKIAGFLAERFTDFLNSEPSHTSGFAPDFRAAKVAARDGDLNNAIKLAEEQLAKEPKDFESLLFMASLYADAGRIEKALTLMNRIITNADATGAQKQRALREKDNYERLMVSGVIKPKK